MINGLVLTYLTWLQTNILIFFTFDSKHLRLGIQGYVYGESYDWNDK